MENARWKWFVSVAKVAKIKRQGPYKKTLPFIALNCFLV